MSRFSGPVNFGGVQANQFGNNNSVQVGDRTTAQHTLTVQQRLAAAELQYLITALQAAGVIDPAGRVDQTRAPAAIERERPKLDHLIAALRQGGLDVLAVAVQHVATPVVLNVLNQLLR